MMNYEADEEARATHAQWFGERPIDLNAGRKHTEAMDTLDLVAQQLSEGAKLLPDSIARLADLFCGCGDPEEVWEWVISYLEMLEGRSEGGRWAWKPESGPEYLAVYVLDHLGLTEHGTSIHCPWLLEPGIEALAFLKEHGSNWAETGSWIDSAGVTRSAGNGE